MSIQSKGVPNETSTEALQSTATLRGLVVLSYSEEQRRRVGGGEIWPVTGIYRVEVNQQKPPSDVTQDDNIQRALQQREEKGSKGGGQELNGGTGVSLQKIVLWGDPRSPPPS